MALGVRVCEDDGESQVFDRLVARWFSACGIQTVRPQPASLLLFSAGPAFFAWCFSAIWFMCGCVWPRSNGIFLSTASGGAEKEPCKGCGSHSLHHLGFQLVHIAALLPFFAGSALRLPWQFSSVRSFFPDSIAAGRFSLIFVSSLQFLHDIISLYTYARTRFSEPRSVCLFC